MSVSVSYGEDENFAPFMKEHNSEVSAHGGLHHQHRSVLQDLNLNAMQPIHHDKVALLTFIHYK